MKRLLLPLLFLCLYGISLSSTAQTNCTTTIDADFTVCANVSVDINYDLGGNYGYMEQLGNPYPIAYLYGGGVYTYLANDIARAKGKDTLVLHNDGYYNWCDAMRTDTIIITVTPAPSITALADIIICNTANSVTLGATFQVATGMIWTTEGSGTFAPDNTTPNATYTLTAADKTAGYFYIKGETTGNGDCNAEDDTIFVIITDPASLDVTISGPTDVCASDIIDLTANKYGGTVITTQWSTSGTGNFTRPTSLSSSYIPSAADKASGSVTLTMSLIGPCPTISTNSTVTIHNTESVSVSVGDDIFQCYDNGAFTLDATTTGATNGVTWSVYSDNYYTGSFTDNTVEDAEYNMDWYDTQGPVTLRLTANTVGNCVSTYDELTLTVNNGVYVGIWDVDFCTNSDDEYINYSTDGDIVNNAVGSAWTSTGTGSFVPDNTELATMEYVGSIDYYFSAADMAAGSVTVTAIATAKPGCPNQTDVSVITFVAPPDVDAGPAQINCDPDGDNNRITMAATLPGGYYQGTWSSNDVEFYGAAKTMQPSPVGRQDAVAEEGEDEPYVNFYSESSPTSWVDLFYEGPATFYWYVYDSETGGCSNIDSVVITRYHSIRGHNDMFEVASGDSVTYNLSRNDTIWGLPYTAVLYGSPNPSYPNNVAYPIEPAADDSIYFEYLNRDASTSAADVWSYIIETSGDCAMKDTFLIMVSLVNGRPVIMNTSNTSSEIQKAKGQPTTVTVDLRTAYGDYNQNINWSTLQLDTINAPEAEWPEIQFDPDPANRYMMTVTYESPEAKTFLGEQTMLFTLCDSMDACNNTLYYKVNVLPNYEDPSVAPEDFVVINAVSPNGDGVNDYLHIYGIPEYKTTVTIYNRWSEKVWEAENYNNKSVKFEGEYNVKGSGPLPEGTYFYVIRNENPDENDEKKGLHSGYLEIRR